jgi:hypothetical protein
VEFAMVGMLVVEVVLECLQSGLLLYQQAELEKVTAAAARQVMVGTSGSSAMTGAQFRDTVLCPMLARGFACSNVAVDVRTVSQDVAPRGFYAYAKADASGLVPAPTTQGAAAFCTGSSGAVVYMRVTYLSVASSPAFRAYANLTGLSVNGVPAYAVTSYAAFRNEPFSGGDQC